MFGGSEMEDRPELIAAMGDIKVPLKGEQKVIAKAQRLRGVGMTYRAVAEKLGTPRVQVEDGQEVRPLRKSEGW